MMWSPYSSKCENRFVILRNQRSASPESSLAVADRVFAPCPSAGMSFVNLRREHRPKRDVCAAGPQRYPSGKSRTEGDRLLRRSQPGHLPQRNRSSRLHEQHRMQPHLFRWLANLHRLLSNGRSRPGDELALHRRGQSRGGGWPHFLGRYLDRQFHVSDPRAILTAPYVWNADGRRAPGTQANCPAPKSGQSNELLTSQPRA